MLKRLSCISGTAFLLGLTIVSPATMGQTTEAPFPISLSSMVLFALHENPDIGALAARRDQTNFAIREKKADLYPQVTFTAEGGREYSAPGSGVEIPGSSSTNNTGSLNLRLSQLIFDGFKTVNQIENRQKLTEAADFRVETAVEDVINQTVEEYLKAVRYQNEIEILEKLITDVNGTVGTIEEMFAAGASDKVMLDYAQARQTFATTELNRAHSSLNDTVSNLEFLVGKLPENFIAVQPEELRPDKLQVQYYLDTIEKENNRVLAGKSEIDAMTSTLKAEKSIFPEVSFNMEADQTHNDGGPIGTENELSATFRLNYKLFDGGKKKAKVNRVSSQITELEHKKLQVLKELRRNVKLSYNQVSANQDAILLTDQEIASNKAQITLNRENFRLGTINVIELIESSERLKTSELSKNRLTYDKNKSAYELLILSNVLEKDYFCNTCLINDQDEDQ